MTVSEGVSDCDCDPVIDTVGVPLCDALSVSVGVKDEDTDAVWS